MSNKLCDLKKLCGKCPKIGNTPLLYNKEKIAPDFGPKTHNTIRVSKKGNLTIGFLLFFLPIFLNKTL